MKPITEAQAIAQRVVDAFCPWLGIKVVIDPPDVLRFDPPFPMKNEADHALAALVRQELIYRGTQRS